MLTSDIVQMTMHRIDNYQRLIKLIKLKTIEEDRCTLPHKVMANFLDVASDEITRWLDRLIQFGMIEKLGPGSVYRVVNPAEEVNKLDRMAELLVLIKEQPDLSFEQQAGTLGITMQELEALFGFFIQIAS